MSDIWSDERVTRLRAMVAEGGSAAAIAEALGGVSRNGVIGKAHRLGLSFGLPRGGEGCSLARQAAQGAAIKVRQPPRPRPERREAVALPPAPEIEPTPKAWPKPVGPEARALVELDLIRQCRMPLWGPDERGGLYCGKPVLAEGKPWCGHCAALVYGRQPRLSALELVLTRRRIAAQRVPARSRA